MYYILAKQVPQSILLAQQVLKSISETGCTIYWPNRYYNQSYWPSMYYSQSMKWDVLYTGATGTTVNESNGMYCILVQQVLRTSIQYILFDLLIASHLIY